MPVHSDPSHPEQNGRHERMHRDLKAACAKPSAYDLKAQQRRLNRFVKEYNHVRPHEALDMNTPASVHDFRTRDFPERILNFDYDSEMKVLKVTKNGSVRWGSYNWVYVSASLQGKYIGALEMGNGIWRVFYRKVRYTNILYRVIETSFTLFKLHLKPKFRCNALERKDDYGTKN